MEPRRRRNKRPNLFGDLMQYNPPTTVITRCALEEQTSPPPS
jgi:hypothetical protein